MYFYFKMLVTTIDDLRLERSQTFATKGTYKPVI